MRYTALQYNLVKFYMMNYKSNQTFEAGENDVHQSDEV